MRETPVRFVIDAIDRDSGKRLGIFQAAWDLSDWKELSGEKRKVLLEMLKWFEKNLAKPRAICAGAGEVILRFKAISWIKGGASDHVNRMHAICRMLNEHHIRTEMITSVRPGYIVFEEEHQIAEVPVCGDEDLIAERRKRWETRSHQCAATGIAAGLLFMMWMGITAGA